MNKWTPCRLLCFVTLGVLGCGGEGDFESLGQLEQEVKGEAAFVVTSPNFAGGEALPAPFTCEGNPFATGVSPELQWTKGPKGTKSYAIVFRDVSIADPNFSFHWAIWNIPKNRRKLPEGIPGLVPGSTEVTPLPKCLKGAEHSQARGIPRFFGPCPAWEVTLAEQCGLLPVAPVTDTYTFTVYALPEAQIEVPPHDATINPNYVHRLDELFDSMDLGTAVLSTTSNAVPTTVPFACP